ncbi:hypothetical protein TNCV_3409431 [Trichonephila clavipes]|nr:hypothetical protein TNCV_3409431 [Trichonephila clavipes]
MVLLSVPYSMYRKKSKILAENLCGFEAYRPPPRSERYGSLLGVGNSGDQKVEYHRGGSGRPRNTNDREDRAIRRVATSAPTTSLASTQRHLPPSSTGIQCHQEKPLETTDRSWLEEPTSAKTLTTDPTS